MGDEFYHVPYQVHFNESARNSGGLHLICRWHKLSSFALYFHLTSDSSSHPTTPSTSSSPSHIYQPFLCCWITTLGEEWALWPLFHSGVHIIHVLSPHTAFFSQAPQRGYTTTWLCPWFTDFWWVFIYLRHSCFCIKPAPHRWNICSSAEKEAIKKQQKTVAIGCCCRICESSVAPASWWAVWCCSTQNSTFPISPLLPSSWWLLSLLTSEKQPSPLWKAPFFLWTWNPWPLMFNILEIL